MKTLNSIIFYVALLYTFTAPTLISFFSQNDDSKTAWFSLITGTLVMFFTKLDSIAEFSLGPIRAKMRERIEQADELLERIRSSAAAVGKVAIADLAFSSFWGHIPMIKQLAMHNDLIEKLREVGLNDKQIDDIEEYWKLSISFKYCNKIGCLIDDRANDHTINSSATEAQLAARKAFDAIVDFENQVVPSPDEVERCLRKYKICSNGIDRWLSDYRHFLKTGEVLREEEFCSYYERGK